MPKLLSQYINVFKKFWRSLEALSSQIAVYKPRGIYQVYLLKVKTLLKENQGNHKAKLINNMNVDLNNCVYPTIHSLTPSFVTKHFNSLNK